MPQQYTVDGRQQIIKICKARLKFIFISKAQENNCNMEDNVWGGEINYLQKGFKTNWRGEGGGTMGHITAVPYAKS